jgi:hypothetical protein
MTINRITKVRFIRLPAYWLARRFERPLIYLNSRDESNGSLAACRKGSRSLEESDEVGLPQII